VTGFKHCLGLKQATQCLKIHCSLVIGSNVSQRNFSIGSLNSAVFMVQTFELMIRSGDGSSVVWGYNMRQKGLGLGGNSQCLWMKN
jgi:hypothetical protein